MMSMRQQRARVLAGAGSLRCNDSFFNCKGTVSMTTSVFHFIPNFEIRSVALLTALTVGAALGAHAQGADTGTLKAPSGSGTPSVQSAPSPSGPTTQEVGAAFTRADANRDGKLSRQEAVRFPAVEQRFDQIDTNKDQFVSREEFEVALKS